MELQVLSGIASPLRHWPPYKALQGLLPLSWAFLRALPWARCQFIKAPFAAAVAAALASCGRLQAAAKAYNQFFFKKAIIKVFYKDSKRLFEGYFIRLYQGSVC